jgi:predicted transcriptional regulator
MPDGSQYFCIARTVRKRHGGYHAPESVYAIGLGCPPEHAHRLVYADGLDIASQEIVRIGTNCRVCDRLDCTHRAFPSLKAPLQLDENVRRIAFYASEGSDGPG